MLKKTLSIILCIFVFIVSSPAYRLSADTFTTTFNANGGTYEGEETIEVLVDRDTKVINQEDWPADPTRIGYIFSGYTVNDEEISNEYLFEENITVEAKWTPKHSTVTLNIIDGEGGDLSIEAIYDEELPEIEVPTKEGFAFIGYFDENDNQYYDSEGKSLRTWDKEEPEVELYAAYEEVNLTKGPLLGNPIESYTVTLDLDGGYIHGMAPEGWVLNDGKYTKQYAKDTYVSSIREEWENVSFYNDGKISYGNYSWNVEPWISTLTENITIKVTYGDAAMITTSLIENGTVSLYADRIQKNSWVYFKDNCIVDYYDRTKVLVEAVPFEGYAVDYWIINGTNETGNDYYVKSDINVKPHLVQSYGLRVFGKLVTVDNYTDILSDGSCSYDPETKTLTLSNPSDPTGEEKKFFYGGIIAQNDLTINCTTNVQISSASVDGFNGVTGYFGIICAGTLTLNFDKELTIDEYSYGSTSCAIYANNLVINKGTYYLSGRTYGIYATGTMTVNSANKPYISAYTPNTTAIMSNGLNLNGAFVYGASEEYQEGVTKNLFQQAQSDVIITFDALSNQYDLWVAGERITDDNKESNFYTYDPETETLNLFGYVGSRDGYGIYCLGDLNIIVGNETNKYINISCNTSSVSGESYGIYCTGDLNISSDYDDSTLYVTSSSATYKSVGIFCDGSLLITSPVSSISGSVNHNGDSFTISAGTWSREGIAVIGQDPTKNYLFSSGGGVASSDYANYGILCGDGNPGINEDATIAILNAKITGLTDYTQSRSYGVYSFGDIGVLSGGIVAGINENIYQDSSIIYCGNNMHLNNANVLCAGVAFYYDKLAVKGIEVGNTLSVNNSEIEVSKTVNEYMIPYVQLKKYQGIYTKNLTVEGDRSKIVSYALNTVSGDSSAIYVKEKFTVKEGTIYAHGDKAGGNSYGIYAGSNEFEGVHSIEGGGVITIAGEAGDGESVGLRTKKGQLEITGGVVNAYGDDYGISASDVIYINHYIDSYVSLNASSKGEGGNVAIKSKEVLQLNDAVILDARNEYDPESTCELIQDSNEPISIYFRIPVTILGVQMDNISHDYYYTYGTEVSYSGTPKAYDFWEEQEIGEEIIPTSEYTYTYQKFVDDYWVDMSTTPKDVGEYRLLVNLLNDEFEGQQSLYFDIEKKEITYFFEPLYHQYDGEAYSPAIYYNGLEYDDHIEFSENPIFTTYEDGQIIYTPSECGIYDLEIGISADSVRIEDMYDEDVTENYDLSNLIGTIRTTFCISDSIVKRDNVVTASINKNTSVLKASTQGLTKDDVKKIFIDNGDPVNKAFRDSIDNDEEVLFISKVDNISNVNDFSSNNRNNNNSVLMDIKLYALCIDGTKVSLTDTSTSMAKFNITVSNDVANRFIGSNKNYYVYRLHDSKIDKLNCSLQKNLNSYTISFYTNKFSSYAIGSEDKPVINYDDNYSTHKVPNTKARY